MSDLDRLLNHGVGVPYQVGVGELSPEAGLDRGRVRRLADDLSDLGAPPLARAFEKVVGLRALEAAPTAFTLSLFAAVTEAEGYLVQRVRRRVQRVAEASAKLHDGKESWRAAEDASTVSPATWDA